MTTIAVGDVVRLKKGTITMKHPEHAMTKRAIVVQLLAEIPGGVRVDTYLGGCRYWNVADLVRMGKSA